MAGEAVSIKGTKNGLVIIFNPSIDIEEVKKNLTLKMESSGGFFKGAKFTVFTSAAGADHHFINELEGICREYGLVPSGEVSWPVDGRAVEEDKAPRRKKSQVVPIRQEPGTDGEKALLVTRTVRSGQRIFSVHNVVVLADVNPGSEICSEGSVYVMGKCLGNIHAGCAGNIMSEVFALRIKPSILRIGTITADTAAAGVLPGPGTARVSKGKIVFLPGGPLTHTEG